MKREKDSKIQSSKKQAISEKIKIDKRLDELSGRELSEKAKAADQLFSNYHINV